MESLSLNCFQFLYLSFVCKQGKLCGDWVYVLACLRLPLWLVIGTKISYVGSFDSTHNNYIFTSRELFI